MHTLFKSHQELDKWNLMWHIMAYLYLMNRNKIKSQTRGQAYRYQCSGRSVWFYLMGERLWGDTSFWTDAFWFDSRVLQQYFGPEVAKQTQSSPINTLVWGVCANVLRWVLPNASHHCGHRVCHGQTLSSLVSKGHFTWSIEVWSEATLTNSSFYVEKRFLTKPRLFSLFLTTPSWIVSHFVIWLGFTCCDVHFQKNWQLSCK